jgi:anti-sigma regulatory factor (Ser/Thr protein kinase)
VKSLFRKHFNAAKEAAPPVEESLYDNQKRALIGWIANRLGQKLRNINETHAHVVDLAACLVNWEEKQDDVYLRIKEMHLSDPYHRCFLEIYEEIKLDIELYVPIRPKSVDLSEDDKVWRIYRDVIYAATQGKFRLIEPSEVEPYKAGKLLGSSSITERSDIPKARELAKQIFLDIGVPQTLVMSHLLVISEAVTNILKHAKEGTMFLIDSGPAIYVIVEDKGPGFPLKMLPNLTLMAGYSTKKSMGQGFTLMMKMTEMVILSTIHGEGSTLILVFERKEEQQNRDKHSAE